MAAIAAPQGSREGTMDDRDFDSLARALSGSSPRRQLLRWVSGLLAGSVAGVVGPRRRRRPPCKAGQRLPAAGRPLQARRLQGRQVCQPAQLAQGHPV